MREIKFRAWDGRKMWLVSELQFAKGNDEFVEHYGTEVGYLIRAIDPKGNKYVGTLPDGDVALLQFTGLKDKNGKEIYEGDILPFRKRLLDQKTGKHRWFTFNGIVEWNYNRLGWHLSYEKNGTEYLNPHEKNEIIGNIYQNKELLK